MNDEDAKRFSEELEQVYNFEVAFYADPKNADFHCFTPEYAMAWAEWKVRNGAE